MKNMKNTAKYNADKLFNFAPESYLERTSRPIYAVVFLLPFIIFYELGTIFINTSLLREYWQGRVVAFAWLQKSLEYLGFTSKLAWIATPLTVVIILIAFQVASRKKWHFWIADFGPMVFECILLAAPLIVLGLFLNSSPAQGGSEQYTNGSMHIGALPSAWRLVGNASAPVSPHGAVVGPAAKLLADIVTGIGAGIYEELVFRLVLICLLMLLFQDILRLNRKNAIILSVLISAALFSAYHHIDFFSGHLYQTAPFTWTEFVFRTIAGVYFAALFAIRGFGITAGTHAFYDIVATLLNAFFFGAAN
ncbi:MAG: CPBP family intramembrane glutamic endopeptidase [Planctomycetota bacterium]